MSKPVTTSREGSTDVAITERVEAHLRSQIFTGELRPQQRVIPGDIARGLHVSRATVREALLRLERYDTVFSLPGHGTFIRDISPEEVGVVFRMRARLESLCVQYMHEDSSIAPEQLLKRPLKNLQKAAAANCEERFFIADRQLHGTIWKAANQPMLYRTLSSLMNPCMFVLAHRCSSRIPLADRCRNHEDYVRLVLRGPSTRPQRDVEQYFYQLYLLGV